ncbi:MAG: hypothetical protein FWE64_04250 [Alphaproteobacteria bacterium]|nr:hypothetical protein [Alphaproteobacteria bacterium]
MKRNLAILFAALFCIPVAATNRVDMARTATPTAPAPARVAATEGAGRSAAPAIQTRAATVQAATRGEGIATRPTSQNISARSAAAPVSARTATMPVAQRAPRIATTRPAASVVARSTIEPAGTPASVAGGYNACRDAYFTCMDQFCAIADESFRRCACSARMDSLRAMERGLRQTGISLQDFSDLNLDAIGRTAREVTVMQTGTEGELAATAIFDNSPGATTLAGITQVLEGARANQNQHLAANLSTAGMLDIGGDINQIWLSSDFIGSNDLSMLTGVALYEQVHAQCVLLAAGFCDRPATLNMVVSAYGMHIEQDCNTVAAAIENRRQQFMATTRQAGWQMTSARLDTHNAHNEASINECIAQVRRDITGTASCGPGFVHCLDVTGLFLDRRTGDPIYSPNFYRLENLISLDGNILQNAQNNSFISLLEREKIFAARGLDTCRDVADDVWEEFKRQAIIEIAQAQRKRVTQVKEECIDTLNVCFDETLTQLRDFSGSDQILRGMRIELSADLCDNYLRTCENLFGSRVDLRNHMHNIGTSRIAEGCLASLQSFLVDLCTPTLGDERAMGYPWLCRQYVPGGFTTRANDSETVYNRLVVHAMDFCVRTDVTHIDALPPKVVADINQAFDGFVTAMQDAMRRECEGPRFRGTWVEWAKPAGDAFFNRFNYAPIWGQCANIILME